MIFTGIEMLFFSLGVLSTLFIAALTTYNRKFKFNKWTWLTLCTGGLLGLFCIGWSVSSVLEGVPRAASMGLVVFGIPSIILLLIGRKIAIKEK